MPLSTPTAPRERVHTRQIRIEGFKRNDGLWDIEGYLMDVKDCDARLTAGVHPAGEPVHEMRVRITIDRTLAIVAAEASTDSMPFPGTCNQITPQYGKLVGMKIRPGFRDKLKEIFGSVQGCTHITELIGALGTGAIQTLAGQFERDENRKPGHLDGCHALDSTGPTVARFYPRWHKSAA